MKILYDYQIFEWQKVGGISRYFYELMAYFTKDDSVNVVLPLLYSNNEYLKNSLLFPAKALPNPVRIGDYHSLSSKANYLKEKVLHKIKGKYANGSLEFIETIKNKALNIEEIKKGDFDIFHPTSHDHYFLPYINDKPFIYTVYDIITTVFSEFFLYEKLDVNQQLLDKAKKVIAISESTKKDIVNVFNIDETKIEVVYLASSLDENLSNVSLEFKENLPETYLLFVGFRERHKNFMFFIQMFSFLKIKEIDLHVICTGFPFSDSERFLFNKLGIQNKVHFIYANDQELAFLYKHALAFVFPSMYEGFGLPVLEAFSCGCPVIVSNSTSLSEIGGDAAVYFEPKDPKSMLDALKSVINSASLRDEKVTKGYIQLKKFSWEKTAIKTKEIYKQALSNM